MQSVASVHTCVWWAWACGQAQQPVCAAHELRFAVARQTRVVRSTYAVEVRRIRDGRKSNETVCHRPRKDKKRCFPSGRLQALFTQFTQIAPPSEDVLHAAIRERPFPARARNLGHGSVAFFPHPDNPPGRRARSTYRARRPPNPLIINIAQRNAEEGLTAPALCPAPDCSVQSGTATVEARPRQAAAYGGSRGGGAHRLRAAMR